MDVLKEIPRVRQIAGEPRRRWFSSTESDLIVWLNDSAAPFGFQLCYRLDGDEYALTWESGRPYSHTSVDAGENSPFDNMAPILGREVPLDIVHVKLHFDTLGRELPADVTQLIRSVFEAYPNPPAQLPARPLPKPRRRKR